tara:strand:+ start:180 stop:461 length:282 start_codon:yes stop_codon:yes gene_type:complete
MAKRKTPKVKDLRPANINKEQLDSIQGLIKQMNQMQLEIGRIETRKHMINHEYTKIQNLMLENQTVLKEEYGEVNINIEDGTITYPEDVKANS